MISGGSFQHSRPVLNSDFTHLELDFKRYADRIESIFSQLDPILHYPSWREIDEFSRKSIFHLNDLISDYEKSLEDLDEIIINPCDLSEDDIAALGRIFSSHNNSKMFGYLAFLYRLQLKVREYDSPENHEKDEVRIFKLFRMVKTAEQSFLAFDRVFNHLKMIPIFTIDERVLLSAMVKAVRKNVKDLLDRNEFIISIISRKEKYRRDIQALILEIEEFSKHLEAHNLSYFLDTLSEFIDQLSHTFQSPDCNSVDCQVNIVGPERKIVKIEKLTCPRIAILSSFAREALLAKYQGTYQIRILKELGRGSYGKIELVSCCKYFKAIKTVPDDEFGKDLVDGSVLISKLYAKRYFTSVDWYGPKEITMEVATKSLNDLLRHEYCFLQANIFDIAEDLISAGAIMHEQGVIHGDLSLRNILLFTEDSLEALDGRFFYFKICDFDSVRPKSVPQRVPGTYVFLAPEILKNDDTLLNQTEAANSWSFGVILFYLLNLKFFVPTDFSLESLRTIYSAMTQEFIDFELDKLRNKKKLFYYLGLPFMEKKLKELGRESAHEKLSALAMENLDKGSRRKKFARLNDQGKNHEANQFLLDIGFKEFLSTEGMVELIRHFIDSGKKIYLRGKTESEYEAAIDQIGEEKMGVMIEIISSLLKINPEERAPLDRIFHDYFYVPRLAIDKERPSEKNFSFLEV